jgi:DNA-binding GntR family transcriptional regulator
MPIDAAIASEAPGAQTRLPDAAQAHIQARTQARRAYLALRDRILVGALPPLTRLKIVDLAAELDISPGAVREALSQLTTDKLVQAQEQRGFRVAPISLEELDDLTQTRIQIETLALRQSIERGGDVWEADLRAAHRALEAAAGEAVVPDLNGGDGAWRHAQFHDALVAGCGSASLMRVRAGLYDQAERYRAFALLGAPTRRPVADEHAAIAAAALSRQPDVAVAAMVHHIGLTARLVREALNALAETAGPEP